MTFTSDLAAPGNALRGFPTQAAGESQLVRRLLIAAALGFLTLFIFVPLVAVIVALPLPSAVAVVESPLVGLTETTAGALDVHVTEASPMVASSESFTMAESVRVSPKEWMTSSDEIPTDTDAGVRIGSGGVPASPPPPPHAVRKIVVKTVTETNARMDDSSEQRC